MPGGPDPWSPYQHITFGELLPPPFPKMLYTPLYKIWYQLFVWYQWLILQNEGHDMLTISYQLQLSSMIIIGNPRHHTWRLGFPVIVGRPTNSIVPKNIKIGISCYKLVSISIWCGKMYSISIRWIPMLILPCYRLRSEKLCGGLV